MSLDVSAETTPGPAAAALIRARRVVIKAGSSLLVDGESGKPRRAWLADLAADLARFSASGAQIVVVSSGAVALGRRRLGLQPRNDRLEQKQAAAAVGQSLLMRAWEEALEPVGMISAQVLLTREDTERRRRWLNARATMQALLKLGVTPVVNENDTVATEEIRYGDNDRLAGRVAQMVRADLMILLSDVDGLYDSDPRASAAARRLDLVPAITPEVEAMAGGPNSAAGVGSGGMRTKLEAARIAGAAGCPTIVTLGDRLQPLSAIAAGAGATLFEAPLSPPQAYKQWIAGSLKPEGALVVDDGAATALRTGRSLLPAGVTQVRGAFEKGDCVLVLDASGRELARGLAAYGAEDAGKAKGLQTGEFEAAIGYRGPAEVIHRDDLVWTER